uniref:Oxidoreductase alpha (Molybdopterin) subunit n=1 Tax=Candidatus Kentrum sp. MB TaxID=2138164 RepID=A0A451BDB8_9GAMM|nr:MAG: oxidoreductase alpha (molybdopterin) subunit [Candidatus Kentron sp. MB]VFK33668.1 MAG: oxidoreductase alpha (molybdopterin) subunit [Candidatus Kentron sp. MB]VFK76286.1 MAG: oxidoreductase alpha (molybdopterin) subunit [Candidatus Kentron sp. MB]
MAKPTIGGIAAFHYSFHVARRVGFGPSLQALRARTACKVCALGTGGQKGGTRNEVGHFPEFCKKNLQSQLTDLQTSIPTALFEQHSIADLQKLNEQGRLEQLGRLTLPLYKSMGDDHYRPIDMETALRKAIEWLGESDPLRSFFYASGRSSNEGAFLLQLFARAFGTPHINSCAYYCHQASGVGLTGSIGTGTATVRLSDLGQSDLIILIGANPASNHPRLIRELVACRRRGGQVIVINPAREPGLVNFTLPGDVRSIFTGGSQVASLYLQVNIGADIALFKGIAKACLEQETQNSAFIKRHTEGFADWEKDIAQTDWARIERSTGLVRTDIEKAARLYSRAEKVIFAWGLGVTQHLHGVDNIESIINLALLRAMVGREGAGLLPLRGHSNVQGVGSMGMTPTLEPAVLRNIEEKLGLNPHPRPGSSERYGSDPVGCLSAAHDGAMDFAFMLGGNLFGASPDSTFVEQALTRIPRKVYLGSTLNSGHVHGVDGGETLIFPVTVRDEERQPTTQESMFSYVRVSEGGIHRFPQLPSEVEIIIHLASRLIPIDVLDFSVFRQHKNIRRAIAEVVPGFKAMKSVDEDGSEFHISGRAYYRPDFPTEIGKARFRIVPIPQQQPATYTMSSVRSEGQFNTIIYEHQDRYRRQPGRRVVLMNADDMHREGLRENDRVTLQNATGVMTGLFVREYDLPPGNLLTYFPEANVLIPRNTDPRCKTPSYKSVGVVLAREAWHSG